MNALKKILTIFLPPYKISDLYKIFIVIFIAVSLPLTVLETTQQQSYISQAAKQNNNNAAVSIDGVADKTTVSGTKNITVTSISQDFSIKSTELLVNGKTIGLSNNSANTNTFTATFVWNTNHEKNGSYTLIAKSSDNSGQKTSSKLVTVAVNNVDTTAPTVSFLQPSDSDYLSGQENYLVKIDANDDSAISQVILTIDSSIVANLTSPPYEYHWDLANVSGGTHKLSAFVFDLSGNKTINKISVFKGVKGISADF